METRQKKRDCRNCYFARLIADRLHCVKNAPSVDKATGCAHWMVVKGGDICGQFRYTDDNLIEQDHWPRDQVPIYRDQFGDYCKIPLTQGEFVKVNPQDYIWLSQFRWHCKVNKNTIYAVRTITETGNSKRIFMHRLIMNTPPHLVCDHINHLGLDNGKANLSNCTISQNNANSHTSRNASSKYKGVPWDKRRKKWSAYIKKDIKQFNLGQFDDEIDAAKAYDEAAKKWHGEFAGLNCASVTSGA